MLEIKNLHATASGKEILRGIDLSVPTGEVHAVMGPNGSGKSTLAHVISGKPGYEVTQGSVTLNGQDLLAMEPDVRAAVGVFLAFQYPVEIPGVNSLVFLKAAVNAQRKARGEAEMDAIDFMQFVKEKMKFLDMKEDFLKRAVNVGFSGGEKKRHETLQMTLLEPKLALLDETDSGLDIDALKVVAEGVNSLRGPTFSALVITHYQRLLDYIKPDKVHVLAGGKIVRTGGPELALELEKTGYADLTGSAA